MLEVWLEAKDELILELRDYDIKSKLHDYYITMTLQFSSFLDITLSNV